VSTVPRPGPERRLPLGDYLVQAGRITADERDEALARQARTGRRLGEVLVEMELLEEADVARALAERAGFPFVKLRPGLVDRALADLLPRESAELHEVLPMFRVRGRLFLAVTDPHRVYVFDVVRRLTGLEVEPVVALRADVLQMITEVYGGDETLLDEVVLGLDEADLQLVTPEIEARVDDIAEIAGESPTVNLVNLIIVKAIKERASDIHLEPERTFFRVRYRIDGVLYEVMKHRIELHAPVVSRLKIMASLDIAERRLPQDGRIQVLARGRTVDLRFSSLPGVNGEKIVLRVLDRQTQQLELTELGFSSDAHHGFRELLHTPHGLVLVTGPTGSGKTTTLYAGLRHLNSIECNIVTIEDPVEYQLDVINQNQVKDDIGLTFARILKHALRQDPDVVMVGEIRDAETAEIAVQAALTGHLVLSTLHTNDAASAMSRLLEMGIEPYLLAASLAGVVAQRLVRTVCEACAVSVQPTAAELQRLGLEPGARLRKGTGCPACFDSGFRGRVGIYEVLMVDRAFQDLLLQRPTLEEIRRFQERQALGTLRAEGIRKVVDGHTTLDEVTRAVFLE